MSDLTAKFAALETQLATQQTALLSSMADINTALGFLGTSLDIMIANNATNTKLLLAAIGQNSPCMPCPTPPITIPPLGDTTVPVNPEACQRSQAFIAFMSQVFTVLDVASSVGIGFNPALITDAFNQVISSLSGGDSPNVISFPEAVQLVGDLVNYIALNITRGATLVGSFSPLFFDLRDALYFAGTPMSARSAYASVIDASGLDADIKSVLKDAAYNDVFSYFFDPASSPDLTGFDGSTCTGDLHSLTECTDFDAVNIAEGGHSAYYISVPPNSTNLGRTMDMDFYGWTFSVVTAAPAHNVNIYTYVGGGGAAFWQQLAQGGTPQTLPFHVDGITIRTTDIDGDSFPFTMRMCPPA